MAGYRVTFKKSVAKDLRVIPKKDLKRILRRIEELTDEPLPPGAEKLTGQERYRIRQGAYRILYEIVHESLLVTVVKVGHRRNVYKGG